MTNQRQIEREDEDGYGRRAASEEAWDARTDTLLKFDLNRNVYYGHAITGEYIEVTFDEMQAHPEHTWTDPRRASLWVATNTRPEPHATEPHRHGHGWTITLEPSSRDTLVADERDWEGVDIDASCDALDAEVERRITEAFPGAEIRWISAYDRTRHVVPGVLQDGGDYDESLTSEHIWEVCQDIAIQVFNDGGLWMRETAADA